MKFSSLVKTVLSVSALTFTLSTSVNAELIEDEGFEVAMVIGGSLQNGQPDVNGPLAGVWYLGGNYKTWVDHIAVITDKDYHWLNYGQAGSIAINGSSIIETAVAHTTWPDEYGVPKPRVKTLVMSFWGNMFLWGPTFNQGAMDAMVFYMNEHVETAKANGIEKIIIMGMPRWEDMDLDRTLQAFPNLPGHIDEAGYNEVRRQYYEAFSSPNPDYVFVDTWCSYDTIDGLHASYQSASKAATKIMVALNTYENFVNNASHVKCAP